MAKLSIAWYGLIVVLATGLTLVSQGFARPAGCRSLCGAPDNATCPTGACRAYEQRAGLPLPYRIDDPGRAHPQDGIHQHQAVPRFLAELDACYARLNGVMLHLDAGRLPQSDAGETSQVVAGDHHLLPKPVPSGDSLCKERHFQDSHGGLKCNDERLINA